jgi:Deoxyribonuclease II
MQTPRLPGCRRAFAAVIVASVTVISACISPAARSQSTTSPGPLLSQNRPVDWWFAFKLNVGVFPGCGGDKERVCRFGGQTSFLKGAFGQEFLFASSDNGRLQSGNDCLGDETTDPVGATFDQVYNGSLNYVLWNDQFYGEPTIAATCTLANDNCPGPWAHSKGMVAWNDAGEGFVMQVTTPDWPGSGSRLHPRSRGNTLGCTKDNNVAFSQSFFAVKLSNQDLKAVLQGLQRASVATRLGSGGEQVVRNGGPSDIQALVSQLGQISDDKQVLRKTLSTGVTLVVKPSALHVPPWHMLSAVLGSTSLRVASWRGDDDYGSTRANSTSIECWDETLGNPGTIQIATSGSWDGQKFSLNAFGHQHDGNHAKIAVSIRGSQKYSIFGDMNAQGHLSGNKMQCAESQNGRGGLFFVVDDVTLHQSVTKLMKGDSAPFE